MVSSRGKKPIKKQRVWGGLTYFSVLLHCHGNCWYVCLRSSDTNETFLQTAECFLPASLEIKLCMVLQKFIFLFFFSLAKWPSGEIVIVSCTFLFWSSCHFLIQLIKGCVFCQGKYIDTSLLLTAEEGHKNFIKGSFCITSFCLAKKCMLQNKFMYRTNRIDLKESTYMVSVL